MIVLAIETASRRLGVALVTDDDGVLAAFEAGGARRHAELLHPAIVQLLEVSGRSPAELDGIAVDVGPGLFTGLRVGVASAKGLALACSLPVVAVTSTEALRSAAGLYPGPVIAVLDVRRGEVAYELPDGAGPQIGSIEELARRVEPLTGEVPPLLLGTGARLHRDAIAELLADRVVVAGEQLAVPSAGELGRIALGRLRAGEATDPLQLSVRYLRPADVAITWTTRLDEAAPLAGGAEVLRRSLLRPSVPQPTERAEIVIGPMRRRHVRAVSAIEERIFTRPWSAALYLSELTQPSSRRYFVALVGGEVVGYVGCMLVAGDGHITTVGVAPEWHRRGVGTHLLLQAANDARALGATALTLEVRVSNSGAQELYRTFGFVPAGIRKNYYAEVNEDAIVMWASDVDSPEYGQRLAAIAGDLEDQHRADEAPHG